MDNPFSSGGFGDDSNAFGAPAFGSENCSETYPGMPPPIDWSATSGGGFGGESNITSDPMAAPSFGGAMGGLSTAAHLAQEHPEIMKASMDGFAAAAQNPSDPPATTATSIAGAVAPAFAIEAQEALNTVTSSVAATLKPGQASGPMFEITVSDPVAQKSGMMGGTHMTYKVNVKTSLPQYQWREFSQIHRYSDFEWLHAELKDFHPNCVVPPIPEKVSTGNTDPEFVARRMWGLQHFLQHCADHPELRGSRSLQFFLEANTETMPEMKKAAQKQKDQAPGLWRRSKMAFKKLDKKYVDPELESQKAALQTLQNTVQRVGNYTARLEPGRKQVLPLSPPSSSPSAFLLSVNLTLCSVYLSGSVPQFVTLSFSILLSCRCIFSLISQSVSQSVSQYLLIRRQPAVLAHPVILLALDCAHSCSCSCLQLPENSGFSS